MLAAGGRRGVHPLVVKMADALLAAEQIALFVTRPEGQLGLAEGKGLPDTLAKGTEIEAARSGLDRVLREGRALEGSALFGAEAIPGLRVDAAAPIRDAEGRVSAVLIVGGIRRSPSQALTKW